MKRIVSVAVLLLASFLVVSRAAEPAAAAPAAAGNVIVPGQKDTASGALHALQTWKLGGIGGKWLAIGQPNTLNRDDRAVFRFGVAMYLFRGKVAKAVLQVVVNPQTRGETFRLDHFTGERTVLSAKDLGSAQVEKVTSFEVKKGTPAGLRLSFDVTGQVNRDLEAGFGFSAFRLRSEFAATVGNPDNSPSLISIKNGTLSLTITP
ncbi:MAG: hypothetical protein HN380_14225 [Victivallales bacterium]|jgi:hypothetical protein|nr:hypothetical protein [Victivallales bacterium]